VKSELNLVGFDSAGGLLYEVSVNQGGVWIRDGTKQVQVLVKAKRAVGSCCKLTVLGCLLAVGIPTAPAAQVKKDPLPFTITGTVITASQKSVMIRAWKKSGQQKQKDAGKEQWLHEGDSFHDYKVVKISKDKVLFEHKGTRFTMMVGYGRYSPRPASTLSAKEAKALRGKLVPPPQATAPALPAVRDKEVKGKFIPPPENIDEIRANSKVFFDKLRKNPQFMKTIEKMRPIMRKRLENANASATAAAGSEPPTQGEPAGDNSVSPPE